MWQQFYSLWWSDQIQFYLEYTAGLTSCFSSIDKHQAGGVDQVGQVKDEVDSSEYSHCHDLVPRTQPHICAAVVWPVFIPAVLGVKVEDRPDDGRWQVQDHSQHGVGWQETGEREREAAGTLSYTQQDDRRWQDEADAVDRHAVLQRIVTVVQHGITHKNEDDAGNKGLADFQQSRSGGHVSGHLARARLADAHLTHVSNSSQAGKDGCHDSVVTDCTGACGTLEEVEREDDGGGQAE